MALSPLFWLQSGLALTDMFGMVFVLAFLLVEGAPPETQECDLARRVACGIIAGLSLGARPHPTLLIVAYWCIRSLTSRTIDGMHLLTALLAFVAGVVAWLIPASFATGGLSTYLAANVGQFEWRLGKPSVSMLGAPISFTHLLSRVAAQSVRLDKPSRRCISPRAMWRGARCRAPGDNARHRLGLAQCGERRSAAVVLSGRRPCQSPAAGRRSRLDRLKPAGRDPLFRCASSPCGLLLA